MAIYTIDGKVYDTDNAEIKISFNRMDYEIYSNGSIGTIKSIFKTKKGNWFIEKICGWFKNKRIVGESHYRRKSEGITLSCRA